MKSALDEAVALTEHIQVEDRLTEELRCLDSCPRCALDRAKAEVDRLVEALQAAEQALAFVAPSNPKWTHPLYGLQDPSGIHAAYDLARAALAPFERKETTRDE